MATMERMPKSPLAAMDADGRCRLSSDPMITVADLELCLKQWMSMMQSRDLLSLTATLQAEANWKTAPKLQAMLQYRHLFQLVFGKCSNTIVSHGRLCAAVAAAHTRQPCLFGGVLTQVGVAQVSVAIRCGAAKWRHATAWQRAPGVASEGGAAAESVVK